MKNIQDLVAKRRSVRTYDGKPLQEEHRAALLSFFESVKNPYGIPVSFRFLKAREHGLNCPVVTGCDLYVGGKIQKGPHAFEAFGYAFECFVLYAMSLGLGTVWLGGTMNRDAYEKAMELNGDEMMPCATPIGYEAEKMSLRETLMRKSIKADDRLPFGELFFKNDPNTPLSAEAAGPLAYPLDLVRLAPSAVNKQPWRVIVRDGAAHFYLKRSKGVNPGAIDMQRIDLGIALCHFDLAQKEQGLGLIFSQNDPKLPASDLEYIASFIPQK